MGLSLPPSPARCAELRDQRLADQLKTAPKEQFKELLLKLAGSSHRFDAWLLSRESVKNEEAKVVALFLGAVWQSIKRSHEMCWQGMRGGVRLVGSSVRAVWSARAFRPYPAQLKSRNGPILQCSQSVTTDPALNKFRIALTLAMFKTTAQNGARKPASLVFAFIGGLCVCLP